MDVSDIDTVAVLGAGNMGHGIAEVAALAGYDVWLRDVAEDLVEEGHENIEWSLGKLVEHGQIDQSEADAALERVRPVVDLEAAVADADVVLEAVPEKMEVKRTVYQEADQYAPEDVIFATNTSSLSVTALSEVVERPEQFCGMHFFNPPVRMQLVEVVAGAHTHETTLETVEGLAEAMGKTPVRVRKDAPGFVVNRVLAPLMNEATWTVYREEASIETVDAAAKYGLGLPMGAFELADQIGLDVARDVLGYLHEELGAAYEPCPLLAERVEAGEVGEKAGVGFYDYEEGGGPDVPVDAGDDAVERRLLAVMANETAKLVADDVADVEQIDRALELGAGFPEGPGAMADERGLAALHETLRERHEATGAARYEPADALAEMVSAGRSFHGESDRDAGSDAGDAGEWGFESLDVTVREGGVGHVVVDREHRMNSLTPAVLEELEAAVEELESHEAVRSLLLTGAGERAFSAGADVQALAGLIGDPGAGVELARAGQRAMDRLEGSDLPVVAGIDGYCLGGGMELAAAADLRVASRRSEFGQTEHDLGLMPGWGGTQRLSDLVGEARAKEIVLTADRYDAATLAEYGFVTDLVESDALETTALELARDLAAGPPIAQRYAKRAIHAGRDDREAGLEVEASAFGHLLGTEDVMEGAEAFMSDRDPEFEGE